MPDLICDFCDHEIGICDCDRMGSTAHTHIGEPRKPVARAEFSAPLAADSGLRCECCGEIFPLAERVVRYSDGTARHFGACPRTPRVLAGGNNQ